MCIIKKNKIYKKFSFTILINPIYLESPYIQRKNFMELVSIKFICIPLKLKT